MPSAYVDTSAVKAQLRDFFTQRRSAISEFGNTVNQTFEAFVFASVINWYADRGWQVTFIHPDPGSNIVKLKFSTRGRPSGYSYAVCVKDAIAIQVRHSLRVATKHHSPSLTRKANVVLDIAVISGEASVDRALRSAKSDDHLSNIKFITFAEAKHMSAFAELIANFVGPVHEMKPSALRRQRVSGIRSGQRLHPAPFLYVSGYLYPTAQGIVETIQRRGYDIAVFDHTSGSIFGISLPPTGRTA